MSCVEEVVGCRSRAVEAAAHCSDANMVSGDYSMFTLRRPVFINSSAEFFTWMCENVESCDYQCNYCISTRQSEVDKFLV